MTSLTEDIYYADEGLLDAIETNFDLVDDKSWYKLYQHKSEKTFWRLDKWDKYQVQFFVRLNSSDNWMDFDDKELRLGLLLKTRGTTGRNCVWKDCDKPALVGLAYCQHHAYEEMGIRK